MSNYYFVEDTAWLTTDAGLNCVLDFYKESKGFTLTEFDKLLSHFAYFHVEYNPQTQKSDPQNLDTFGSKLFLHFIKSLNLNFLKICEYLSNIYSGEYHDISYKLRFFMSFGFTCEFFIEYLINNIETENFKVRSSELFSVFTYIEHRSNFKVDIRNKLKPEFLKNCMHRLCSLSPRYNPIHPWDLKSILSNFFYNEDFSSRDKYGKTFFITRLFSFKKEKGISSMQ